jgi:superfamily II DNA or RNA helicase
MSTIQPVKQTAFKLGWQNNPEKSTDLSDGFYAMRDWQIPAFELLKDSAYMILNAPMGSGKSWMMCLLSAYKMKQNKSLRTIIAVPQTIIAPGFIEAKIEMPDGEQIHWKVRHNLCGEMKSNRGTVNHMLNWLISDIGSCDDKTIICTHTTLVALYRKLKSLGKLQLLQNLLIWIDEAHHVKNVTVDGFDAVISNGLGELVTDLLMSPQYNTQIGLTTASFFRGDRCSLLTSEMESRFKRFNLPYDEYLRSMKYLKSFSMDFVLCGSNYYKAIEILIQQRQGKDIIYIPHPTSQYSSGDKYKEVKAIVATYGLVHGAMVHVTNDGILTLSQNNKAFNILDLVDESQRREKKQFLNESKREKNDLDSIIALGMFKEGANWIWADRSIIVGSRSSLVDVIQMIGRLFRDAQGKEHVEVFQLLPFALDQKDEDSFRENLNNYLKALYASLILENVLSPVKIKTKDKVRNVNEQSTDQALETNKNWLAMAIPDDSKQLIVMEDMSAHLIDISTNQQDAIKQVYLLRAEYDKIAPKVLEKYGIIEYKEEIASQIWNLLTRRSLNLQGIAVEDINFEILQNANPLDCLVRYTSGVCTVNTLQKLREAIALSRVAWRSFEEAREFVRTLGLKSETEWQQYTSGTRLDLQPLPVDIPKAPWLVYKGKWISMGDFFGTNQIAPRLRQYASYEEACRFAQTLNLKRKEDWVLYCKGGMPNLPPLPGYIPASPAKTYKRDDYGNKWTTWGAFLGTYRIGNRTLSKMYRPYREAQLFADKLGLKSVNDWRKYLKNEFPNLPSLPSDIPRKPDAVYKEWVGWPTFLGVKEISKFNSKRSFWSFAEARDFVHKLGLKKQIDWQDYCAGHERFAHLPAKPLEIPSNPSKKYKNQGWKNHADWIGLKNE